MVLTREKLEQEAFIADQKKKIAKRENYNSIDYLKGYYDALRDLNLKYVEVDGKCCENCKNLLFVSTLQGDQYIHKIYGCYLQKNKDFIGSHCDEWEERNSNV